MTINNNWIIIENRNTWIDKIESYHPDSSNYINQWKKFKLQCIEGTWRRDFDGYRYMPPQLYFYINFCRILDVDELTKSRKSIKPLLRDLEWEMAYLMLEARGFSGWRDDEEYTSNLKVKFLEKNKENKKKVRLPESCYKQNGELKKFIEPRDNIRKLHDKPLGPPLYLNDAKNAIIFGSRGGGKQLQPNELIRVKNGWKEIQNLNVGELVYGSDGKLAPITFKSDIKEYPYYKITLRDGREIEACENHLWKVWDKNKNRTTTDNYIVKSTKELFSNYYYNRIDSKYKTKYNKDKYTKEYRYALPINKSISEDTNSNLPIDPYLLGLLLGDGSMTQNVSITSIDNEIIDFCKNISIKNNWTYRINKYENQNKIEFFFTNKNKEKEFIKQQLEYLNLLGSKSEDKFIPEQYLYSKEENRWELLRGLMDTDGFADKRHIEYYTISKKLSKDVENLIRSLGLNCKTTIKDTQYKDKDNNVIECKPCYRISIYGNGKIFNLERKQKFVDLNINKSLAGQSKWRKSFITKIEPIGNRKGLCIGVANEDNTYITKDYIVTHNSYYIGLANILHEVIFDGAKYYTQDSIIKPSEVHCNIGSWESNKSSDLCEKIELCMNNFAIDTEIGVWGDEYSDEYTPMPFYKSMSGTLTPNNNKSPWAHIYQQKVNGKWIKKGSKSKIVHSVYKDNVTAAAGGRYSLMVVEEAGLHPSLTLTHNSNIGCTQRDALKFGTMVYIGTSGDIEKVRESRKMFMDPEAYDIVAYDDVYENSGKIGFFIPAYYTAQEFKDENGNTDVEASLEYYLERRKKARASKDANNYEGELMNYPIKPSEMFLTKKGNILPIGELEEQRANVTSDKNRRLYYTVGSLLYDSKQPRGVKFYPDLESKLKPIFDYPTPKNQDTEGALIIYEHPIEELVNGKIEVPDIYIIGFDPVDADTQGQGLSLSCLHVLKTPRNTKKWGGNELVASYIGRPYMGRDAVNEVCEKLAMWYGGHNRMISFERGGNVKEYFQKKNKLNLLMPQPKTVLSYKSGETSRILLYGTPLKSFEQKFEAISMLRDWLLEEYGTSEDGRIIRNLNLIRDTRLLEEMIAFDFDNNFDSVLAFAECIIGLREKYNQFQNESIKENKTDDIISFLNKNLADRFNKNYSYN